MKKLLTLFTIVCLTCASCTAINTTEQHGTLVVGVKFPERSSFNLKVIPNGTVKININISGELMENSNFYSLTREEPRIEIMLPFGKKTIHAQAIDTNENILAESNGEIVIKSKIKNTIRLELGQKVGIIEEGESIQTPVPVPTPTPTPNNNSIPDPDIPSPASTPTPTPTPGSTEFSNGGSQNNGPNVGVDVEIKEREIEVKQQITEAL